MRRRALALAALLPLTLLAACAADPRELAGQPPRVVFFEGDSAALGDAAKPILDDVAGLARRYPTAQLRVLGFAGPVGTVAYNRALSEARAQNVAGELEQRGVARARITVAARGPVSFDMAPIESRRVEILIGAQ